MIFRVSVINNKLQLITDDLSIKSLLEYKHKETKFNPFVKKWVNEDVIDKVYLSKKKQGGVYYFELGLGFGSFIINYFGDYLLVPDKNEILKTIYSENYRSIPFRELYDYQNEDLLHLLKFKFGLFSCYTGYGKSMIIVYLINYAYTELGESVLVLTPSTKTMEELIERCNRIFKLSINKDKTERIRCIVTSGVMNSKKFTQPDLLEKEKEKLSKYKWIIADEVEYCCGEKWGGGHHILEMCTGAQHLYGFSGTSDKSCGEMISFIDKNGKYGLNRSICDNKYLVSFFGPSLVYRLPTNKILNLITVKTKALNNIKLSPQDEDKDGNIYIQIMTKMWTDPEVCKVVCKIIENYPFLYIPINMLEGAITYWVENVWKGKYRVLLIKGKDSGKKSTGYIYYDLQGNSKEITLSEAKELAGKGEIDVLPGTSSSFRGLDLPGLKNMLFTSGNIAGNALQELGRVARSKEMNIIELSAENNKTIPVFTKGVKIRKELIEGYYKYCKINYIEIEL